MEDAFEHFRLRGVVLKREHILIVGKSNSYVLLHIGFIVVVLILDLFPRSLSSPIER